MATKDKTPTLAQRIAALRLGDSVSVQAPAGSHLRNTESGACFVPEVPTPQTVTTTLLRRLQDGDLVLL
ncbi:hypothetical protein PEC18_12075 [Paucibacter sp. O1-1]|nr:hypothetical protein [Paucibacter sp. O1-1]MDA3826553.1 hypothetical protein [Paucibacter sp. O1-1]